MGLLREPSRTFVWSSNIESVRITGEEHVHHLTVGRPGAELLHLAQLGLEVGVHPGQHLVSTTRRIRFRVSSKWSETLFRPDLDKFSLVTEVLKTLTAMAADVLQCCSVSGAVVAADWHLGWAGTSQVTGCGRDTGGWMVGHGTWAHTPCTISTNQRAGLCH